MGTTSNYSICYEPIQRLYRNAVVQHARTVLSEAFPDWQGPSEIRTHDPFLGN